MRHLLAIPFQSLQIVLVTVEEVHLAARLLYARMQIEHLQQRPRAALAYTDYQRLKLVLQLAPKLATLHAIHSLLTWGSRRLVLGKCTRLEGKTMG